jgi:hypothetical protein
MENNTIKREYTAFSYHAWRNWNDNVPTISFNMQDGQGNEATQFLNEQQVEEVIELLKAGIAEAKALEEHKPSEPTLWNEDTPF